MPAYLYDFNGPDTSTAEGIPVDAGLPPLQVVAGAWQRLDNRAYTPTTPSSDPILVMEDGVGNADISVNVDNYGGDAIYARVSDPDNWVRLRVRTWQTSYQYTYYVTEYEWASVSTHTEYQHVVTTWNGASMNNGEWTVCYPTHYEQGAWTTDSRFPAVGDWYASHGFDNVHSHTPYDWYIADTMQVSQVDYYYWSTSTYSSDPNDYRTGSTRSAPRTGTGYETHYGLYLEKCVNGTVYQLDFAETYAPASLRLRLEDSDIKGYHSGEGTPLLTATDAFNATVARHGIGRAYSEFNQQWLDNLSVDTLNTPSNSPGIIAPVDGEKISRAVPYTFRWQFSDPDPGDSQTGFQLRYRETGAATWGMLADSPSADEFWTVPAFVFDVNTEYEWQVRTMDEAGEYGPWSPVMHFTTLAYGSVIAEGQIKEVGAAAVIVGGVKKPVTNMSVIVGGVKKPVG